MGFDIFGGKDASGALTASIMLETSLHQTVQALLDLIVRMIGEGSRAFRVAIDSSWAVFLSLLLTRTLATFIFFSCSVTIKCLLFVLVREGVLVLFVFDLIDPVLLHLMVHLGTLLSIKAPVIFAIIFSM